MTNLAQVKLTGGSSYHDLYEEYGVMLVKGAYEELVQPPAMKDYIKNESRLENGTRYTFPTPRRKAREFSIQFAIEASGYQQYITRYNNFIAKISGGTFLLKVPFLGLIFKLVYLDCEKNRGYDWKHATFTLKLAEPNPADREEIT